MKGGALTSTWLCTLGAISCCIAAIALSRMPGQTDVHPIVADTLLWDFGSRSLDEYQVSMTHQFTLTNRSDRDIEIAGVSTTCGCTDAGFQDSLIPPGESTTVSATLTLSSSGRREAQVVVAFKGDTIEPIRLTLSAHGKRALELTCAKAIVTTEPDQPESFKVFLSEYDGDAAPAHATVATTGPFFAALLGDWELVHPRSDTGLHPALWAISVEVRALDDDQAARGTIHVAVPGSNDLDIPLRSRPGPQ